MKFVNFLLVILKLCQSVILQRSFSKNPKSFKAIFILKFESSDFSKKSKSDFLKVMNVVKTIR